MAMTYDDLERSTEAGRPLELYVFTLGALVWRYTTADRNILIDGNEYFAATLLATNIQQTGEYVNDVLSIDVPVWIAPAQLFMTATPSYPITVEVFYQHVNSTDIVVAYIGEIRQVDFPAPGRAKLSCESLMSTMSREGLRLAWQRACPYALYDPTTCKVDKALWKIDFIVLAIDGFTVDVALDTTQLADHFSGGFMEWAHPIRGLEFLAIETHTALIVGESNARFTLFGSPGELFEGARGSAYPGCRFTPAACTAFNNFDNYGGVPDMPGKSPFDGDPVF